MTRAQYAAYLETRGWRARAKACRERYRYRCGECGAADVPLEVHHLNYARLGCELPNDLIPLCESCHDAYHPQYSQERAARRRVVNTGQLRFPFVSVQPHTTRPAFFIDSKRPFIDPVSGQWVVVTQWKACHVVKMGEGYTPVTYPTQLFTPDGLRRLVAAGLVVERDDTVTIWERDEPVRTDVGAPTEDDKGLIAMYTNLARASNG